MNLFLKKSSSYRKLPINTRLLVISFALRSFANPLLSVFVNSFIWRNTSSFLNIALFNLGLFVFLPLGFWINGALLKKIKLNTLYLAGLVISTISMVSVIFFSGDKLWHFIACGLIFGLGEGIYWANRNFLTYQETKSKYRNFFFGINSAIGSTTSLCVTLITGCFITLGEHCNFYTSTTAYWIFSTIALSALISSGLVTLKVKYKTPSINEILLFGASSRWNKVRFINISYGLLNGIFFFLPTLLIMSYLGSEAALGGINTIVSLLSIAITYLYGKFSKWNHRRPIFYYSLALYILLSIPLLPIDELTKVMIFVLFIGIPLLFQGLTLCPLMLDVMDAEINKRKDNRYSYIIDQEIFLNIGRVLSVMVFFVIGKYSSLEQSLLISPFVVGIIHLFIMIPAWTKNLSKKKKNIFLSLFNLQ